MSDLIVLEGLEVQALIGVYDWERTARRPLVFDLRLRVDLRRAGRSDDVADTVDYAAVAEQVSALVAQSTPQLLEAFLQPLIDAGVDAFHCSQRRFWEPEFDDSDMNLAGWVKKLTGMPTITVGSVSLDQDFVSQPSEGDGATSEPASIDRLLEMMDRGDFDLVAVGRALIANPDWPKVVRSGDTADLQPYNKDLLAELA